MAGVSKEWVSGTPGLRDEGTTPGPVLTVRITGMIDTHDTHNTCDTQGISRKVSTRAIDMVGMGDTGMVVCVCVSFVRVERAIPRYTSFRHYKLCL